MVNAEAINMISVIIVRTLLAYWPFTSLFTKHRKSTAVPFIQRNYPKTVLPQLQPPRNLPQKPMKSLPFMALFFFNARTLSTKIAAHAPFLFVPIIHLVHAQYQIVQYLSSQIDQCHSNFGGVKKNYVADPGRSSPCSFQ